MSFTKTLLIF